MLKQKKFLIIILMPILLVIIWFTNPLSLKDRSIKLIQELNIISAVNNTLIEEDKSTFDDKPSKIKSDNSVIKEESTEKKGGNYQNKNTYIEKLEPQKKDFSIHVEKKGNNNIAQDVSSVSDVKSNNKIYDVESPSLKGERFIEKDTLTQSNMIKVIQEKSLYISILLCIVEIEKSLVLGHPYVGQIDLLRELLKESDGLNINLAPLIKGAKNGMPSRINLYNEFQLIRLKTLSLPTEEVKNMNFLDRAYSKISSLILVTKNPDNKENKLRAILNEIEEAVTAFNINNILNQYNKLSNINKEIMNDWIEKIKMLQDAQLILLDMKKSTIKNLAAN